MGINTLLILAPGKDSIYPEFIPEQLANRKTDTTNYEVIVKELDKIGGIDYLNLRKYFIQIIDTVKYPLFPQGGTHWSGYCVTIAADTLIRYMKERYHYILRNFIMLPGEEMKSNFRFTDDDLAKILNVFFIKSDWTLYYPDIEYQGTSDYYKPNALIIGDSFSQSFIGFYSIYDTLFSQNSCSWAVYKEAIWPPGVPPFSKDNLYEKITNREIIILVATEINYPNFSFGFIVDAYSILCSE